MPQPKYTINGQQAISTGNGWFRLSGNHTKFYKTLPTGQGSDIVTVDTLSTDLATANTLSISGAHGSITTAQYNKLNKGTIVI